MKGHTNLDALFHADKARLRAFRQAAYDTHRHLRPEYDRKLSVGSETSLIPEAVLRAASQPLRLAFLEREQAYLPNVIGALHKLQDPDVNRDADKVASVWERVRNGQSRMQYIDRESARTYTYGAKELLDIWFYGKTFHQRPEHEEDLQRIRKFGELAVLELQMTVLKLGMVVFALDTLIADVLGEDALAVIREANEPGDEFF